MSDQPDRQDGGPAATTGEGGDSATTAGADGAAGEADEAPDPGSDEATLGELVPAEPAADLDVEDPAGRVAVDVPDPEGVDPELRRAFWRLVGVFNVAVLAIALGALILAFTGRTALGAGLVGAGLLGLGYGYRRYRRVA